MKRILILSCSSTKIHNPRPVPAWHRYDGPAWRTLRCNIEADPSLDVFALSAEHGLIPATRAIGNYDRLMTPKRAAELLGSVSIELEKLGRPRTEILAFGGGVYRDLLEGARGVAEEHSGRDIPIAFTRGGIGEQLHQLKAWLRREA